jgi:hypothetical protein
VAWGSLDSELVAEVCDVKAGDRPSVDSVARVVGVSSTSDEDCVRSLFVSIEEEIMCGKGERFGSFSLIIVTTIFSKSPEVICRSRPLLRLLAQESCRCIWGRTISNGSDSAFNSRTSSSATESTLPDNCGTSGMHCLSGMSWGGIVVVVDTAFCAFVWVIGSQQRASLVHKRQLRFSSLRPCSTDSAHLEKTVHQVSRRKAMLAYGI